MCRWAVLQVLPDDAMGDTKDVGDLAHRVSGVAADNCRLAADGEWRSWPRKALAWCSSTPGRAARRASRPVWLMLPGPTSGALWRAGARKRPVWGAGALAAHRLMGCEAVGP